MESMSLSAERGCPFCNFHICQGNACMFFGPINETDFDCLILATFWFVSMTYGYTALAHVTSPDRNQYLSGYDLRPEAVQKRVDATHQALGVLEALEKDICMSADTKAQIQNARMALSRYVDSLKVAQEFGDRLVKMSARKKRK